MKSKHLFFTFLFLTVSLMSFAQMSFDFIKGYIVNNRDERIHYLIKNLGSEESTVNYEYKLAENDKAEKIELSKIQEFGIDNELKCIRALIAIDFAPSQISNVNDALSQWEEDHAFLKVLVEGKEASLYSHNDNGASLFFFSVDENTIKPLIYKKYNVEIASGMVQQVLYDNTYKEQLEEHLVYNNFGNADRVQYTKKDLVNYFTDYNKCMSVDYTEYESAQVRKGILLFKPAVFLNRNELGIESLEDTAPRVFFTKENSVSVGVELEYIFPFNNYSWGFLPKLITSSIKQMR